jgi:hypothetical protein
MGMIQLGIHTKWRFLVEFEDEETGEVSGLAGEAETRDECDGLIDHEIEHRRLHGRRIVNIEAGELCSECNGNGAVPAGDGGFVLCSACEGHLGPISVAKRW